MSSPGPDPTSLAQLVSIGLMGGLGALSRYGVALLLPPGRIPWGTLAVNVVGSFLLGLLVALGLGSELIPKAWRLPLTTGFMGAFTTYSTFSVETVRLLEQGDWRGAGLNLLAQLGLGLVAAGAGLVLGRALTG